MLIGVYQGPASEVDVALQSRGLQNYLQPVGEGEEGTEFVLKNEAVGEVVYHLMLVEQRQRLHKSILEWYLRIYRQRKRRKQRTDDLVLAVGHHASRVGGDELAKRHLLAAGLVQVSESK